MPASVFIKFILYNQKWKKLPLSISSETSFYSRQHKLLALVDMVLHFSYKHQSRFAFRSFSARFVCIADELTSPSVFPLSLIVGSKSYGFSLSKLENLSSESEELKEGSLDNKLESLIVDSWNLLKDFWILIIEKLKIFSLLHEFVISSSALCDVKLFESNLYIFKLKQSYES